MNKIKIYFLTILIFSIILSGFLNTGANANDKIDYETGKQQFVRNFRFKPDDRYKENFEAKTEQPEKKKPAGHTTDGWFVGLTYPGVTAGYQGRNFGAEIRAFFSSNITVYGPRFTHYAAGFRGGTLYWGLDLFKISEFEGDLTEGDGLMGGIFFGIQKFIGSRFSLTLDSGPYNIMLEDSLSEKDVDGLEFVVNTGLNFHF
ncbi:MAG: hypothetical protein ACLFN5_04320 [bacterium]